MHHETHRKLTAAMDAERDVQAIVDLMRGASLEINVRDLDGLGASRALLPHGQRVFVSHLPRQTWDETIAACSSVSQAGFDPIPHVPVRLLESEAALDRLLDRAVGHGVREVLLIAGDYAHVSGPYAAVADVLRTDKLNAHGLQRVSLAGHPEGHPRVPLAETRRAEVEKAALAAAAGLETSLITQFFFEAPSFLEWVAECRAAGVRARLIAGLAGPASVATLFRYAVRCGVGPSIRALGARPTSLMKLVGDHGPEKVLRALARARTEGADFQGVHFFCFGGFLRTCEWLSAAVQGKIELEDG